MKHKRSAPGAHRALACALVPALSLLSLLLAPAGSHAAEGFAALGQQHEQLCFGCCEKHRLFRVAPDEAPRGAGDLGKFAPDRKIDLTHLKLDFTPDFEERNLTGTATLTFTPIAEPLEMLRLDAVGLDITRVTSEGVAVASHHASDEQLELLFRQALAPGKSARVSISYSVEPEDGLFFRTEAMGYQAGDDHFFTQGEPERHRYWFPSHDYPNDRFSTEVVCHMPEDMIALSNGRLISKKKDPKSGLTAFHWRQDKPHVNYLVSVVGGYFKSLEDRYRNLPVAIYTQPSDFEEAPNSFVDTVNILAFFEKEIGVPFPWDKYYNVVVKDFMFGGMENTSITTLTDRTLFSAASENIRTTRGLDAHEIAHQWFGDLVTCKDWSHVWLNEGFATYYTQLYEDHKLGREAMQYGMYRNARRVLDAKDDKPIVWRGYARPADQFDYRAYPKGAWVLHMLRAELGPELFRRCIRTYLEENAGRQVVTEDLNRVIERISGRSFDRFFDQWVYHGGLPELSVRSSWNAGDKLATVTVTQKQKRSERVPLFHVPLGIRFHTAKGVRDFTVRITRESEDFRFSLPAAPTIVRIDPDYELLARIDFTPPNPLLYAQLENEQDMMGRLQAVLALGKRKDAAAMEKLAGRLERDPFWAVRLVAAESLAKMQKPEALAALIAQIEQPDARVRQQVARSIASFYRAEARDALLAIAAEEANPEIVAEALKALGKYPRAEVRETLSTAAATPSYRHLVAGAAVAAMKAQDDPSYVKALFRLVRKDTASFETRGLGAALDTLAYLARGERSDEATRDRIRHFIAAYLEDPRASLRAGAIKALGTLRDPRSIPLLEALPGEPEHRPEVKAREEALKVLRAAEDPASQFDTLRRQVLDLQKKIREIEKNIEEKHPEPEKEKEPKAERGASGKGQAAKPRSKAES